MHFIKNINEEAYKWILNVDSTLWCRYLFDDDIKCDHVTNNMSESLNHMLGRVDADHIWNY